MLSDGERYLDHAVVQYIAAQWVGQPPVGLMVEQPSAAPMVVLRSEAPTAELRFEAPYMVEAIVPTLALQRGSRLGRLPVQLRLRPIAIHHPTARRHPTTSPGSRGISCKCAEQKPCRHFTSVAAGLPAYRLTAVQRERLAGYAEHDVRVKVALTHGHRATRYRWASVAVRPRPQLIGGRLSNTDLSAVSQWIRLNEAAIARSLGWDHWFG
jgi:predicted DNA-binding transcriptional regulator AlpA